MAIVLLAGAAAVLWLALGRTNDPAANNSEAVTVARQEFASTVVAIGAVKPQIGAEVRVGSRISGRIERLSANIGDVVERGQVLAELESADLSAAVASREAAIAVAESKIADAEARARLAESNHSRQEALMASGSTSQQILDEALREKESAAAGLEIARRELDLARANLQEARIALSYATIQSPISGVIASVTTQEGETVAAGLNAPTFVTILDLGRLQVNAYVDEVDIGKIKAGQPALFTVDAYPARDFTGRVSAIYPTATIQDNVVKYIVVVALDGEQGGLLRPEMTASVQIKLETRSVLAVPARAIRREDGADVVYVLSGDEAVSRPVRVGWREGPWAEIVDGLAEGERILVDAPAAGGG